MNRDPSTPGSRGRLYSLLSNLHYQADECGLVLVIDTSPVESDLGEVYCNV